MSWTYRGLVRPLLFAQDSEQVHHRAIRALALISRSSALRRILGVVFRAAELPVHALGLRFPNPVGLAAGMDKAGEAVPAWEALGFGFSELGGITRHGQPGNDPPRVFRVIPDGALVNRMGFNNPGAEAFATALKGWRQAGGWPRHPVGINLGKSKITPLEEAAGDYDFSFRMLRDLADFFVVNVSSPNTPNLRRLQDAAALDGILACLNASNESLAGPVKPLLVKVAPDLSFEALDQILEIATTRRLAGIVATNTTLARSASPDARLAAAYRETGGLSGRPLAARSTEVIRHLHQQTRGRLPIIGVGGIFDAQDAWEKITAGATLLQVYTGMVFEGPGIARSIVRGLQRRLAIAGLSSLADAVGLGTSLRSAASRG